MRNQSPLPIGTRFSAERPHGYYIDFRSKARTPDWPPEWFPWPGFHRYMATAQWGLGAYERYVLEEGERWLTAAIEAAEFLVREQEPTGRQFGGWLEPQDHPHTFDVPGPWLSAMTQGQCASLLVRLHLETGDTSFGESARRALEPMDADTGDGGVRAWLGDAPFLEEYPTKPPSFVLNGALFALWGVYDVSVGLGADGAERLFREVAAGLAANLDRWDTGFWSRYDLFPHPVVNIASPFYHYLHINQLRATAALSPHEAFHATATRFERYAASAVCRWHALARKVTFRLLVR